MTRKRVVDAESWSVKDENRELWSLGLCHIAVRVILVRIPSMWAFRVLARMGLRGRPPVNKPLLHI